MRNLLDLASGDPRVQLQAVRGDLALTEEQFRRLEEGAVPIFAEASLRLNGAVPTKVYDDPGAITSRKIKLVDMSDVETNPDGTGGTFDKLDQAFDDQTVLRHSKNWTIPRLELLAAKRSQTYDPITAVGERIGELLAERENQFIVTGAGGTKGISNFSGIDTFAGAAWSTSGNFWKNLVAARGRLIKNLKNKNIVAKNLALVCAPDDETNAYQAFSNTAIPQSVVAGQVPQGVSSQTGGVPAFSFLPGGIHTTTKLSAGKAYFYVNYPDVMELEVFEDLTTIPLPMVDESPRGRMRLSEAFHIYKPLGIAECTGI